MCEFCGCEPAKATQLRRANRAISKVLRHVPIIALSASPKYEAKQTANQDTGQSDPAYSPHQTPEY